MDCILGPILSILRSDGFRSLFFSLQRISRPDKGPPFLDGILRNKFHANSIIRGHEIDESGEEGLALVFAVEIFSLVLRELEHL